MSDSDLYLHIINENKFCDQQRYGHLTQGGFTGHKAPSGSLWGQFQSGRSFLQPTIQRSGIPGKGTTGSS